jgi:hypothetical protein
MTLQQGIVDPAFKSLGLIAAGRSMATSEYADALDAINALLDMCTAEEDMVYQITKETFSLTGPATYTMGPAGTFATVRPTRIRAAVVIAADSASQPIQIVPAEKYAQMVEDRTLTGLFADVMTCDYASPAVNIFLNPAPVTGATLELWSLKPLSNFAAMSDTVSLPPGYLQFLKTNLAVVLAPAFAGAKLTNETLSLAQSSKAGLAKLYRQTLGDPFEPPFAPPPPQTFLSPQVIPPSPRG